MFLIWHIMDFGWWGRLGFLTAKKNPGLDKIQGAIHRLIRDWKFLISTSVNHKGFCVCVGGEERPIRPALQLLRVAGWQAPGRVLTPLHFGIQCFGSPLQLAKRAPWGCDSAWVFYKSQISYRQKSAQVFWNLWHLDGNVSIIRNKTTCGRFWSQTRGWRQSFPGWKAVELWLPAS